MTKKLLTLSVTTLIGLFLWLAIPVRGQTDDIVINGADATVKLNTAGDATLNGLVDNIGTRFILYYANGIRTYKVAYFGNDLNDKLNQLPERFIVQYANALKQYPIAYPVGITDDKTAPTINEIKVTVLSDTSAKITWKSNEYATGVVRYGTVSGNLSQSFTDGQFYFTHEVVLSGLNENGSYFYKLNGVDRSGNPYQSAELSFTLDTRTPTPTHTPTKTLTPTPTPTFTPTFTPTDTPETQPVIDSVRPNQGSSAEPNEITVNGRNFQSGAKVSVGNTQLTTTFVDGNLLRGEVPVGLAKGLYAVTVTNPDGGKATMANAYTVFDEVGNDDLFTNDYELVTDPVVPLAGSQAQLRIKIHRQGGKVALANVKVRFYLGNPQSGGSVIGDGEVAILSPGSAEITLGVAWIPAEAKEYTLYAVIDPDNAVSESFENNNVVKRTILVLPPAADTVAPRVDAFSINDGALLTRDRIVRLNTTASDPASGSGVAKLYFVEFEFSQGANDWVPVRVSPWLDYESNRVNHNWSLVPASGLKYLQAWAADGAGNISLFPSKKYINYLPDLEKVGKNQRKVYRFALKQNDKLKVRLEPVSGDPDLYVWSPDDATEPPWVSNLPGVVDDLTITAAKEGEYQVQVHGFSAAEYRLIVTINDANLLAAETTGGVDPSKSLPDSPLLADASEPPSQFGNNSPGATQRSIYLPLISR